MSLPYLIYYLEPNPNYGKTWTLDDIPEETEECFECVLGDYMTRGRPLPTFEQWAKRVRKGELESRIRDSKCELRIQKMCILDEEDLIEKLRRFDPTTRFVDKGIQSKFEKLHEQI